MRKILHGLHEATTYAVDELLPAVTLPFVEIAARVVAALCPCGDC